MKLDCKAYLEEVKEIARKAVQEYKDVIGEEPPILHIFNKNNDKANETYVNSKVKHCADCNIPTEIINGSVTDSVYENILAYSTNICLVQKCEDFEEELDALYGDYDMNLIDIEYLRSNPNKVCTPAGVVNMLKRKYGYNFEGKTAVIINRSNIIGKPLTEILLNNNATPIIAHSKTPIQTLRDLCKKADLIFVGVGIPNFIDDTFLNNSGEQIVIDFGINRDINGKLCGDINELAIKNKVKYYTATPGGTGLTTVAQLIENITDYYKDKINFYVNVIKPMYDKLHNRDK